MRGGVFLFFNGQRLKKKQCTSCVKGCEEYKKTFKTLDCNAYCTVEYGAPKPTDEVYMCSIVCIEVCMSSIVLMRCVCIV